jgi:predicted cobalt transporter CbtA
MSRIDACGRLTSQAIFSVCLAGSVGLPGMFLAGYASVEAIAQLQRFWLVALTHMCLGVVIIGSRRRWYLAYWWAVLASSGRIRRAREAL